MPFQKGQPSANPGGRPKRAWSWAEELVKASDEVESKTNVRFRELVARRVVLEAAKGNMLAAKELFNRIDGMPKQNVDVTSDGEKITSPIVYIPNEEK